MYRFVLFTHVLGAIVSVGPAVTYGVWIALARREGEREQSFAFRGVLWLDSHVVTPAFVWQLISGLLLVFVYNVASFQTPWLSISLAIYGAILLLALAVISPRARRAARALASEGPSSPAYLSYRRMMRFLSPIVSAGTLAIVYLMVVKPG